MTIISRKELIDFSIFNLLSQDLKRLQSVWSNKAIWRASCDLVRLSHWHIDTPHHHHHHHLHHLPTIPHWNTKEILWMFAHSSTWRIFPNKSRLLVVKSGDCLPSPVNYSENHVHVQCQTRNVSARNGVNLIWSNWTSSSRQFIFILWNIFLVKYSISRW